LFTVITWKQVLRVLEICKQENDLFLAVMLGVSRDW